MSVYRGPNVPLPSVDANGNRIYHKRYSDPIYYRGLASKILGGLHVVGGLLSMALGVGAICTVASGYDIGYGIWAGFVFTTTGVLCIVSSFYRTAAMVMATLMLSLVTICCGAAQFSLGIVAAVNDRHRSITGELSRDTRYLGFDIYYRRNDPFHYLYSYYCTDTYGAFTWEKSWGPVDVLLLLVGAIEAIIAIISSIFCCISFCCGDRRVSVTTRSAYNGPGLDGGSYYNEGFDSRSAVSAPTFYKVVQA